MENLVFVLIVVAVIFVIFLAGIRNQKLEDERYIRKAKKNYGEYPRINYDNKYFTHVNKYYEKHKTDNHIDDITWSDLDMDTVFARVNYCESAAGQEYLYHTLRTPSDNDDYEELESHVKFLDENADVRTKMQLAFHKIGNNSKYSIYDYLDFLDALGKRSNAPHIIALIILVVAVIEMFFAFEVGFMMLLAILVYNVISYFKVKGEIDPYLSTFAYIMRLMKSASSISALNVSEFQKENDILKSDVDKLKSFQKGSGVLMSQTRMGGSGNPLDVLYDYIRIITHIDLIKFNQMYAEVAANKDTIDEIVTVMGKVEMTISVACFRKSLMGNYSLPVFDENSGISAEDMYHLLIDDPVVNSVTTNRGILLTGSNASGKSTFLKTVALCAVLSQTIHTSPAKSYKAPMFRIYSSMALRDDLSGGDSYYIVETKSLKRILDAADKSKTKILCFVDEVLRGTNTIERIAASAQILKYFASIDVFCFAATHDIELTTLLDDYYDIYHFEGLVDNNDVHFDYKLHHGPAVNRNAIKLLGLLGYDKSIIDDAENMAQNFEKNGIWTK